MVGVAAMRTGRIRLAVLLVGVGSVVSWTVATSAVWTESVTLPAVGPAGGPLNSSAFGIEQRTVAADGSTGAWVGADGGADPISALPFGESSARLLPGAAVYGGLELRTRQGSRPGLVTIAAPRRLTGSGIPTGPASTVLWGSLTLRLAALPAPGRCDAAVFETGSARILYDGPVALQRTSVAVPLAGSSASPTVVCFEVGLPVGASDDASRVEASWSIDAVSLP